MVEDTTGDHNQGDGQEDTEAHSEVIFNLYH
jgi:hypothetical protein